MKKRVRDTDLIALSCKCCNTCSANQLARKLLLSQKKEPNCPPTEKQSKQRSKFKLAGSFASNFSSAISIGRQTKKGNVTAHSLFMKDLLHSGIVESGDKFMIDYPNVVFSINRANKFYGSEISFEAATHQLRISCMYDGKSPDLAQVHVVVYNESLKRGMHLLGSMAGSDFLTSAIEIPQFCNGDVLHYWFFLVWDKGKSISKSRYFKLDSLVLAE